MEQIHPVIAFAVHAAVDMEVGEAGGDEFVRKVDHFHIRLLGKLPQVDHIINGLVLDNDHFVLQNLAVLRIKELAAFDSLFHGVHPPMHLVFFRGISPLKNSITY